MRRSNGRGGLVHWLVWTFGLGTAVVRGVPAALRGAHEGPSEPINPATRFEPGDLNPKAVFLTGVGVLAGTWLIALLVYPLFSYLRHERAEGQQLISTGVRVHPLPPEPRIQESPTADLEGFRKWEESQLHGYHWVDRAHNVVSIPIDQAIKMVAQRGIPPQAAPAGKTYFHPREGTRETGFEGKVEPEPR